MSAEQIKALFASGKTMTQESFASLVDFLKEQKGPKGDPGETGKSITAIALTTDESGKVTGGTATLSDRSTVKITVSQTKV